MKKNISQYEAAKIAGVSKQAINSLTHNVPLPMFFVRTADGLRVDPDHPTWKLYLQKQKLRKMGMLTTFTREQLDTMGSIIVPTLQEKLGIDRETLVDIVRTIEKRAEPYIKREKHAN